jgi:hypothetical protein
MIRCAIPVMGLLVVFCHSVPTTALASPKARENSAAAIALDECLRQTCGRRLASISGSRQIRIENCFRAKIGKYPAEMGLPVSCPWSPYEH